MRDKLLASVFLTSAIFILGCAVRRYHDYVFSVTGLVTAEDGAPVQNAEITLEVNGPVYKAATSLKTAQKSTDNNGGFVFTYISHQPGVKYTITVRREGFEPQTVSGIAPPVSHHEIRLKKAGGDGEVVR